MAKSYQVTNKSGIIPASQQVENPEKQIIPLLDLISNLIDHITDPKPLGVTFDSVAGTLNYFKSKFSQESSESVKESLNKLTEKINCEHCKNVVSICKLNCGHQFCENCIEQMQTPTFELFCSICTTDFYPLDVSEGFMNKYNERMDRTISKICVDCGRKTDVNMKCRHYCGECLSLKYRLNDLKCNECRSDIDIPDDLFEKRTLCAGCENLVYVIGDFTTTICKNHTLCLRCLKEAGNSKKCTACESILDKSSQNRILKRITAQCSRCSHDKSIEQFIPKQCCKDLVCADCQKNKSKCQVCSNFLDPRSLSIVYNFSIR